MLGIEEVLCELKEDINEQGLPPGFRFHPTDEELITFYLASKVFDAYSATINIAQVDLNRCEPWDLPDVAKMGEREWYFFSLRDRKYPTGLRTNRATGAGYWKATGKDREVFNTNNVLVGMKKTLVFYKGRAPRGEKTRWVMHEYRLEGQFSCRQTCKEEWVICRIFHKIKDKKPPILYQGRHHHHHHDYMSSSSYFAGPSSPSDITNTLPPLPALLESEPDHIFQNINRNTNDSTFSINALQLPSTTTPLATFTQNKRDSKTNNSYPSQSNVLIKSLHSNQICTFEQEDPTPTANTIPIQCKTETNSSSLFPLLLPPQHANLRWGCDQQLHHYLSGLDFTALGFSPLGPTGPTRTTTSSTSFDFSKAFGSAPSAAVRESWPLDF